MIIDTTVRRIMHPEQPEWLTRLQNDLALITAEEARKHWPASPNQTGSYYNYRLEHVQQVERDGLRLLEAIPADQDIFLASAWIHDRFQPQYEGDHHAARAADWACQNLAEIGFPAEKVPAVVEAVARHSDPPGAIPEKAINARLLWDADKLTKIGPLNIVTYLMAHPAFPERTVSFASMALHGLERLERSRRLVESMYFDRSRQIALERYKQQKAFYEAMANDVEV